MSETSDRTDRSASISLAIRESQYSYPLEPLSPGDLTYLISPQYEDPQYLEALQYLIEDERVRALGLCNFDTQHMENALAHEVKVHSNQVQVDIFSSRRGNSRVAHLF